MSEAAIGSMVFITIWISILMLITYIIEYISNRSNDE